jgi:hypothetical protein
MAAKPRYGWDAPVTDHGGRRISGTGVVSRMLVEGGFFAIRSDAGVTYDPVNLPVSFQQDGLRVRFEATLRRDLVGVHMAGPLIEIVHIAVE